ncbi:hypothetical protein EXU30_14460 [Shewanella maritima]|uniref:Cytochrome P460 domain-containing protein n=1 Tax=Shewanella maritima TaxID=2520507 RepID=A0A411PJH9_9GAMM|nr:cytochrome P460 family protein [Shewanella maritima]QBF83761.1 hypothetical protein EXU30_14460 [Shewanella maritima]
MSNTINKSRVLMAVTALISTMVLSMNANAEVSYKDTFADTKSRTSIVDEQGQIHLPEDYALQGFVHLGSNTVTRPDDGVLQNINSAYTQADALIEFNKTGVWPDGTVIIKDIRFVSENMSLLSGEVQHQASRDIAFVMVKDSTMRFYQSEHKQLWDSSWGWAQYDNPEQPLTNTNKNAEYCQGATYRKRQTTGYILKFIIVLNCLACPHHPS